MKRIIPFFVFILMSCQAWGATTALEDYGKAQTCYKELKANEKLLRDSKNWVRCIADFKAVAESHPKDPKAPEALYSAARLNRELGNQTGSTAYIEEAIHLYNTVVKDYPQSSLADDSLYQIGLLRREPLKDDARAKRAFETVIARYPKGDMAPKAKDALKAMGTAAPITEVDEKNAAAAPKEAAPKETAAKEAAPVEKGTKEGDDQFRLSKLMRMNVASGKEITTVTLELDRQTPFTIKFVEYGTRTKTPARLTLEFPRTKSAQGIASEEIVRSEHISSIKIKEGVFTGELVLRFEMMKNVAYDIVQKNERTIIRFYPQGVKPPAPAKGNSPKETAALEAKKLRIVIDPGHGGKDTGAIGPNGVEEKTVTLSLAKKLAAEIGEKLGAEVYLTRTSDKDVPLEKRNAIANAKKADLFISIHANASTNRKAGGIETYYLNNASDEASKRLAQRENKSAAKPQGEVDKILLTLFQNYNTEESRVFADDVHRTMYARLSKRYKDLKDHQVRSALFYVLVGAKCPGILVETSFISNPVEEKRLNSQKYQGEVASAIAAGVERYVKINKDRLAAL